MGKERRTIRIQKAIKRFEKPMCLDMLNMLVNAKHREVKYETRV